ncbi:ROK family protein [Paenibacillus monticola]|uniref:ROK family protein n=1 Tax=Paenibacillus monticola TaxID=2666075 RepID=A0A7X2L275_9BACL|nr:ROK family protein [Paenibacillus monticola]MRN53061.1 ROK family protein [Paenibacillus monticola]
MEKANGNLVKEINVNNVREAMKQMETATKSQLAVLTKLSVVTINSLIKELLDLGEIFEDETVPSNGGRPALTYRYNYDFSLALVIYMNEKQGKDVVLATVINLQEKIIVREEHNIPLFDRSRFYEMIDVIVSQYPRIKVIGIGIPGQSVNGEITVSSHEKLQGVRMIEEIQGQFGLPVILENDVNAAISGYCARRESVENQCILGVYFPETSPPGMGIYMDRKVVKGKDGMAGEIKFLPIDVDWNSSLKTEAFIEIVCTIIQTLNAVLAPDQIVIYQSMIDEDTWARSWKAYKSKHYMASYAEIILLESFHEDFEAGMRWLTLKELEPSFSVFK